MLLLKYPKWWFPFRILTVPFENYEKPRMWMLFTWALPNIKTCAPGPTSTVATATNAPRENTSPRYTKGKLPSSRCRFESVAMHVSSFDITSILFHEFFQKGTFLMSSQALPDVDLQTFCQPGCWSLLRRASVVKPHVDFTIPKCSFNLYPTNVEHSCCLRYRCIMASWQTYQSTWSSISCSSIHLMCKYIQCTTIINSSLCIDIRNL